MLLIIGHCEAQKDVSHRMPSHLEGSFKDDYGIYYSLTNTAFNFEDGIQHEIVEWNIEDRYFIALNDSTNNEYPGLYSRIDWMEFENMEPYTWGFCITIFDAATVEEAKKVKPPDRENPLEGCNGFPFSRMKRIAK
jgi:hypothetical protein